MVLGLMIQNLIIASFVQIELEKVIEFPELSLIAYKGKRYKITIKKRYI